ncbi:FixH family protein [Priestia aryabhattai]|uniref:FixH family protein n=1 Tax=Priestia aryabhattai TaxID=412384 RepID=UPI001C8E14E9|nr:FixH family protein [Priestia aryabhattai]MBY0064862.1 FixH family protein [Priestia aryabhattai]
MNKWKMSGLVILSTLLLSACSVDSNADQLYKQPKPLSAHVMLPENIEPQSTQVLEVHVMQENKTVDDAKIVQFNVWKKDDPEKVQAVKANYNGGMYTAKATFEDDGVYYIKTDINARGEHILPTQQVAVGKLSKEELRSLQPAENETHHHHSHH